MYKALTDLLAYQKAFSLSADMENTETQVWLEFARSCQYLGEEEFTKLTEKSKEIGKLLDYYMHNPALFRRKSDK